MSDATTGVAHANARVSTIPKLSPPSDGATSAFAASSSSVRSSWLRKPSDVDARRRGRAARASSSRTGSGSAPTSAQPRAGAPVDLRPGAQQHRQPLARVVAADEDDAVLAPAGVGLGGIRTPFGTIS